MNETERLVKQLFIEYQSSKEYYGAGIKYRENFERAYEFFVKLPEGEETFMEAIAEREEFAFLQGFKFAMNFRKVCEKL